MSVSDGQNANASTFNGAFVSKTSDSVVISKIDLSNTDPASGSSITNIQKKMNDNTTAIDDHIADTVDAHDASAISYVNTTSGLTATESQAAIDEVDQNLDNHIADAVGAHASSAISYDNGVSGLTAIEVKSAIDELESLVSTAQSTADAAIPSSEKGAANGVAELDGTGKVPASQLPTNLMQYQGNWDANTNSPTLTSGVGTQGDVYRVSVAGTTNLDGITDWQVGDWAAYNGTAWEKSDNTDQVTSVAGKQGAVTLTASDIANVPLGNLSSSDVQNALDELQGDIDTLQSKQDPISGTSNEIDVSSDIVGLADNPVLPGQGSVTIPKGTTAQRSGTPVDGMFRYNSDDNTFEGYSNSAWGPIGGAGGVGGGLDAFLSENFSSTTSSDFSTGKNATFLGGGTLGGTISDETTSPLEGATSIKYVAGASSQYDYLASPVITLDERQKAHDCGMNFYFTWDGSVDVQVVVWDVTNSQNLLTTLDVVENKSGATRYSCSFYPPSNCASIRYGFHFINTPTSGDILIFDCVELSTNPFVYKNLVETSFASGAGNGAGSVTANVTDIDFTEVSDIDGLWSGTVFTVPRDCLVQVTGQVAMTASGAALAIYKNGTQHKIISYASGNEAPFSFQDNFVTGDQISIRSTATRTLNNLSAYHHIEIHCFSESEHVVTPAKSDTQTYYIAQLGSALTSATNELEYNLGTATIYSINSGYISVANASGRTEFTALKDCIVNISASHPVANAGRQTKIILTKATGTEYAFGSAAPAAADNSSISTELILREGDYFYFQTSVNNSLIASGDYSTGAYTHTTNILTRPVEVNFLAAVPTVKTAYIDVDATNYSYQVAATTSYKTRTLNKFGQNSDTSFCSISSNQLTLDSGRYEISVPIGKYFTGGSWVGFALYNVTDASIYESFTNVSAMNADGISWNFVQLAVEITSQKTFEFRTIAGSTSGYEYIARIKVKKIR